MIDAKVLLTDLTRLLKRLEDDLRERALSPNSAVPELRGQLQAEWQAARDAERTAETFESWAEQVITQAGVHWLLSCVFLRFIEDNGLVDRPWISGTPQSGRLALARDSHDAHFRAHPHQNDRDFLIASFREAGALPGLHTFFEEAHNPVFRLGISGDAAMAVMQFWQEVAADSGLLVRDFTDPAWNTRFLGDLYQDLSEATRKRYALLQTPEFVEEFILNRTLTPAIQEFGYREARLIDPTCGSGHFLLGAFHRLVEEWVRNEPGRNPADVAQKALDAVAGVDLNPFAVAIARFRLLLAALQVSQVQSLAAARDFKIHVAIGDSLLHGKRFGLTGTGDMFQRAEDFSSTGLAHAYLTEDLESVQLILGRQYHAVVGNPPYIVVSDAALNGAYRSKYASCHRQYSLGAPFTERFFELAVTGRDGLSAGFVGLITANSFMKREFGSKLIEQVLPRLDLTHVIDTAAANIPGHGTPTVIIFGRHRPPVGERLRVVMGIKGEPMTPVDPSQGLVWTSILRQIDVVGSESEYISVQDMPRSALNSHPWSIGGGGAGDLKALIESNSASRLSSAIAVHRYTYFVGNRQVTRETVEIGFVGMTHADEAMVASPEAFRRKRVESQVVAPLVVGDEVRDWTFAAGSSVLLPHSQDEVVPIEEFPGMHRWLWPFRTTLGNRATFGKSTYFEEGRPWWAWHQIALRRVSTPPILTFSFIATHSHFAIDRGGNIFKQSAPVIKLRPTVTLDAMQGITGLLNSSIACFWLQQVCHNKGGPGGGSSKDEKWHDFYEFSSTNIAEFPLIEDLPVALARRLDELGQQYRSNMPAAALAAEHLPSRAALDAAKERAGVLRRQMFAAQEELD
jgi:hypothetical protein